MPLALGEPPAPEVPAGVEVTGTVELANDGTWVVTTTGIVVLAAGADGTGTTGVSDGATDGTGVSVGTTSVTEGTTVAVGVGTSDVADGAWIWPSEIWVMGLT